MKKIICCVIVVCSMILNFSFVAFANIDGYIKSVNLSAYSSLEGNQAYIAIDVETEGIEGSRITAELVKSDGTSVYPKVDATNGYIVDGKSKIYMYIPSTVKGGSYNIKVYVLSAYSQSLTSKDTAYTVYPTSSTNEQTENMPSPVIDNVNTDKAFMVEGFISGELIINGSFFSNVSSLNSIAIKDESGKVVKQDITPNESSTNIIESGIPKDL